MQTKKIKTKQMKKKLIWTVVVLLLIIGIAGKYIIDRSMIFTGYAAKNLASGLFIAERTQESLEAEDLNFSLVSLASNKVDYDNKVVFSNFLVVGLYEKIQIDIYLYHIYMNLFYNI